MIGQEAVDGFVLIRRPFEDVTESTSRKDDFLASTFWIIDGAAIEDLGCSDRRYEGADRREERIESGSVRGLSGETS